MYHLAEYFLVFIHILRIFWQILVPTLNTQHMPCLKLLCCVYLLELYFFPAIWHRVPFPSMECAAETQTEKNKFPVKLHNTCTRFFTTARLRWNWISGHRQNEYYGFILLLVLVWNTGVCQGRQEPPLEWKIWPLSLWVIIITLKLRSFQAKLWEKE